jgi:hypothetical protein
MADGTTCIVTAVEHSASRGKERACNSPCVGVHEDDRRQTQPTMQNLRAAHTQGVRRPRTDPHSRNHPKRKRFTTQSRQSDHDDRPPKHNRTEQIMTRPIADAVERASSLVECHTRINEDNTSDTDDAPDEDDAVDETNDAGCDRQQHNSAGLNRRRRRRRTDEAPSDRQPKRSASSTNTTTPGH